RSVRSVAATRFLLAASAGVLKSARAPITEGQKPARQTVNRMMPPHSLRYDIISDPDCDTQILVVSNLQRQRHSEAERHGFFPFQFFDQTPQVSNDEHLVVQTLSRFSLSNFDVAISP